MGVLDFIFGILVLAVIFIIGVGAVCMKWDTKKLEEENIKLKEELKKSREKKSKSEYKKVSKVGGKRNAKK